MDKVVRIYSIMMIYLIVSLSFAWPINAAITTIEISGIDRTPGFRRVDDITNIFIESTDGNVWIKSSSKYVPLDCVKINTSNQFFCRYNFDKAILEPGQYSLNFRGMSTNLETFDEISSSFVVDGNPPKLQDQSLTIVGESVDLYYDLTDFYGVDLGSGVKSISLFTDSETLFEKNFNSTTTTYSNLEKNISGKGLVGNISFYLGVRDKVGNYQKIFLQNEFVDLKKPVIDSNIKFMTGETELTQLSAKPEFAPIVTLEFRVDEHDIKEAYVDVSDGNLDPTTNQDYSKLNAYCTKTDVKYTCQVPGIYLNPGKNNVEVKITVIDSKDNVGEKTIVKQFEYVEKQGTVTWFGPDKDKNCYEGNCYIKRGVNEIFLKIDKGEAPILPGFITAYVGEISRLDKVKPIMCDEDNVCRFYLSASLESLVHTNVKKIVLTTPSTDAVGTPLTGVTESVLFLDFENPINKSAVNFTAKIGGNVVNDPCVLTDEVGTFTVNIEDDFSPKLRIVAHTQNVSGSETFENDCVSLGGGKFTCSVDVQNFASVYMKEDVGIDIVDLAGNKLKLTKEIEVCESNGNVVPEVISSLTIGDLPSVDLFVSSVIPYKVYIPFKINKKSGTEILTLGSDNCMATVFGGGKDTYYIGLDKVNTGSPILVTQIGGYKENFEDEGNIKIPLNCTVKAYVRTAHTRYTLPELEKINVDLEGYRLPLGRINDSVSDKLDDLKDEIKDLKKDIDSDYEIQVWLDRACWIADIVGTLRNVIGALKAQLYAVSVVLEFIPGVGSAFWLATCNALDTPQTQLAKWWPIDSVGEIIAVGTYKAFCMINKCSHCSFSGLISIGQSVGSTVVSAMDAAKATAVSDAKTEVTKKEEAQKTNEEAQKTIQDSKNAVDNAKTDVEKTAALKTLKENLEKQGITVTEENLKNNYKFIADSKLNALKTNEVKINEELKTSTAVLDKAQTELDKLQKSLNPEPAVSDKDLTYWGQITGANVPRLQRWSSAWMRDVAATQAENIAASIKATEDFDPYKSMTVASGCGCWPARIYNRKKEAQMLCKEYTCIKNNVAKGLPINVCENTYKAEHCLYYTGAYFSTGAEKDIHSWMQIIFGDIGQMDTADWTSFSLNTGCFILELVPTLQMTVQCGTIYSPAIVCEGVKVYEFWKDVEATLTSFISPFKSKDIEDEYCGDVI